MPVLLLNKLELVVTELYSVETIESPVSGVKLKIFFEGGHIITNWMRPFDAQKFSADIHNAIRKQEEMKNEQDARTGQRLS